MRLTMLICFLLSFDSTSFGISFRDAMKSIQTHEKVQEIEQKSKSIAEFAESKGSWGDPMLKIAAKNYPVDSLDPDKTPMTGTDIVLSQKIPLTAKYNDYELELKHLSEAELWQSKNRIELLRKKLWSYLITIRKLSEETKILTENFNWLQNIIKVSQNLYSTGKQSQQALLELKIRKSELKSSLKTKEYEISEIRELTKYLVKSSAEVSLSTVPWNILSRRTKKLDAAEKSLISKVKSKDFAMTARSKSKIPDLTLSLGYTKRSNVDSNGDFVTVAATLPLPTSNRRYADYRKSLYDKEQSEVFLADYRHEKATRLARLKILKEKILTELKILTSETIAYAENSRIITTKSYQLGNASYIELLQSELKLQNLKMKKVNMTAKLRETNLTIKALLGEKLYE